MELKPEQLLQPDYVLLDKLGLKELIPFIRTYLKKKTFYSRFYYIGNLLIFGFTIFLIIKGYNAKGYDIGNRLNHFAYGLGLSFVLVPLHEYIHVLAYKSQGAIATSYGVNLKKFYFMALADKFVASKKEFTIVALAPFLIITVALLVSFFFVKGHWNLTITGTLLAHTAMCSGDFGLLSYFSFHKDKEVVTYDDVENGVSFFYEKKEP